MPYYYLSNQDAFVKATGDAVTDKAVDQEFLQLALRNRAIYIPTLFVLDGYGLVIYNSWEATSAEQRLADPEILAHMHDLETAPKDKLPPNVRTNIAT